MPNYISQITLPNGGTYELKDLGARAQIQELINAGISFKISTDAATTPEGIEWLNNNVKVVGTLVASANTKASVYLVPHEKDGEGKVDFYREYVTVNFGTEADPSFAWEFLGTTEIDIHDLGALAYKNDATGSTTLATADSAAFSNGAVNASATYTPAGSVAVTLSQTGTAATLAKGDYTPAGSVNVTLSQTDTAATLTKADYTPAGSVSTPTITVTPSTTTVEVKATAGSVSAGSAASFTEGAFTPATFTHTQDQFTAPVLTAEVADGTETLTIGFNAGSFTEGSFTFTGGSKAADTFEANTPTSVTLPTFTEQSVVTGIASATSTQPTFTGTKAANALVTGVSYDKAEVDSASFTGTTAEKVLVTGVTYDKAGVQSAGFTGTEATISSTGTATGEVSLTKTSKTITVTVS